MKNFLQINSFSINITTNLINEDDLDCFARGIVYLENITDLNIKLGNNLICPWGVKKLTDQIIKLKRLEKF
jgi:hypothetical protein